MIAIACGGTGGHLFPGLAVAEELLDRRCEVTLLVSPKEVDQQAVKSAVGCEVVVLPAVGLTKGRVLGFAGGFMKSWRAARRVFRERRPAAVLAMGGFTSAPPVLAGKSMGIPTFLHESNTLPGRANRWLARFVDRAFVGFSETAPRLRHPFVSVTGTPVRPAFQSSDEGACRLALGLSPRQPVLLVQGGSQGAHRINEWTLESLPRILERVPELQIIHLTGAQDAAMVKSFYETQPCRTVVLPFLTEMELALGAATVSVSRAGASSLAELAAMRLPAILVPYPHAVDDHQYWNAKAYEANGAAIVLSEKTSSAASLAEAVFTLVPDQNRRQAMRRALEHWDTPLAAELIADKIMSLTSFSDMGSLRPMPETAVPLTTRTMHGWKERDKLEFCR